MPTISSRDFDRDVGAARRSASTEPVIITDRGKPPWVAVGHDEEVGVK